jgi:hypothetical protein
VPTVLNILLTEVTRNNRTNGSIPGLQWAITSSQTSPFTLPTTRTER